MDKMNKTRQLILDVSKQIFLDKGYSATTFQMIADEANISKTSINYYYARKQDISNEILSNYIKKCREFVVDNGNFNDLMAFLIMVVIFMKAILATQNTRDFYLDLIRRNNASSSPHADFQSYYLSIIYHMNLDISPDELSLKKISIYGATNELALNYLTNQLVMEEDQFVTAILYNTMSILKATEVLTKPAITASLKIYDNFDKEKLPTF
ncbi:MAG: TetR/AcrR family transcriptional regulator [Eubacteriaceae bacterium]|jgi:AcrR family transcriptional regulator|nr:TetR/AcrR family transcriptional regulator [Eubacteriaceae bacterium]